MKTKELRTKNIVELKEELLALLREQFNLRLHGVSTEKPKAHVIKVARKNIARVKTIIHEKMKEKNV